jgi:hypothetical protein
MLEMRAFKRILQKIWFVQDLFQRIGFQRGNPWSEEVKLVKQVSNYWRKYYEYD